MKLSLVWRDIRRVPDRIFFCDIWQGQCDYCHLEMKKPSGLSWISPERCNPEICISQSLGSPSTPYALCYLLGRFTACNGSTDLLASFKGRKHVVQSPALLMGCLQQCRTHPSAHLWLKLDWYITEAILHPSKTYKNNMKLGLAGLSATKLEFHISSFMHNKQQQKSHLGSSSLPVSRILTAVQMCRQNGARWNNFRVTWD